jgi:hypothetical protein
MTAVGLRTVVLVIAIVGCGGGSPSGTGGGGGRGGSGGPGPCHTGETVACTCADGTFSVQECRSDGTRGSCECGLDPLDPRRPRDGGGGGAADAGSDVRLSSDGGPVLEPRLLLLPGNDLAADPARDAIYISVRADSAEHPSSVTAIAPATGAVLWSVAFTPEPGPLAISDDGSKLYVGFAAAPRVERVDLASRVSELALALGAQDAEERHAADMAVIPGAPRSVLISMRKGTNYYFATAGVFDDATMRAMTVPDYANADVVKMASATTAYAYNRSNTGARLMVLTIGATGITVGSGADMLFDGFMPDIAYRGGLVYGWDGRVVDAARLAVLGRHDMQGPTLPGALDGNTLIIASNAAFDRDPVRIGVFAAGGAYARMRTVELAETGLTRAAVVARDGTLALIVDGVPPGRRQQVMLLLIDAASLR